MQFQKIICCSSIIIGFLSVLWLLICYLLHQQIPNELLPKEGYIFDYVVVGAGTAGSVVASLLAKHSNATVLLIEAGEQFGLFSKIPLLATFQQQGLNDWSFMSVPQQHAAKGLQQQQQKLPRGKGLGGSSQLNFMLHFDGHDKDFNNWAMQHNLTAWNWQSFRPFLQAARAKPHELFEIPTDYSKLTQAMRLAEAEFAQKLWRFRYARYNIKNGLRHSVYQRFLQPAFQHSNLHIMSNALASKILLEHKPELRVKALNVRFKSDHGKEQLHEIAVRKQLILSAGAYQTPQLLLASGIGDATQLKRLKIPLKHELPQVGRNLFDHINMPLFVSINVVGPTLNQRALLDPFTMLSYLTSGTGHFGNFGVLANVDAIFEDNFGLTLFGVGAIDESALMSLSNFERTHFHALFPRSYNSTQEGFVLISTCLQPQSRGTVTVRNANMRKNPLIDPNYLSNANDVHCLIRAMRATVELITSVAFKKLQPQLHWPKIRECSNFGPFPVDFQHNTPSDRYLECIIRHVALTAHHPGGSCAMGGVADTTKYVVDEKFRVYGISNLRIVDASVLPSPISGNPNTVLMGMAIRAATWLLQEELSEQL